MAARDRDRYLDGKWVYTEGNLFFDADALEDYFGRILEPWVIACSSGDTGGVSKQAPIRMAPIRSGETGSWWLWRPPVRARFDDELGRELPAHRYIIGGDVSSGTSNDYSALQVIDVESFEQVAEFQGLLDMDELALEMFRAGVVYNGSILAPEVTGGWG